MSTTRPSLVRRQEINGHVSMLVIASNARAACFFTGLAGTDMYQQRYISEDPPPYHPSAIRQWANRVTSYSSQYNNTGWSANQVLGQPRVYPQHGDLQGAWASSVIDSNQFLEIEFEVPVKPTAINIYETYNPGAVVCIKAKNPTSQWTVLWRANRATHLHESRIFSPRIADLAASLTISQLRIEVDCSVARDWCELDAVELVGIRPGAVMPVDDGQFFDDMKLLVNNKLHSDVELVIDGSTVYAHKAILSARSPFFAKMFKKQKDEKVNLKMPNVSKTDLVAAFTFIYTNRIPSECSIETLVNLCKISDSFDIRDMRVGALYKMTEMMTCENVVSVFMSVEEDKSAAEIKSMCIKFMSENLKNMSHVPSFEKLSQKYLVEVVQNATANLTMNT